MDRTVIPEILDSLPPDDPEAARSRRELRLINALMGNHRWLLRRILAHWRPGMRVLELGAGDGALGVQLAQKIPPGAIAAMDLAPRPPGWPAESAWMQADVLRTAMPAAEIVVANLFLHHFQEAQLAQLAARIPAECDLLLFSEPARRRVHLWQGSLLAALSRFGRITRHDMPVSIRAGFAGRELPRMTRLEAWQFRVSTTLLGAYRCEGHRI